MSDTQSGDNPFEMTTDVNGKPIPRWQLRLEGMYTDNVPFGEILGYVRFLMEERDIAAILSAPDEVILEDFKARGGNPEEFAAEMRQKFDVIARQTRENEVLRAVCESVLFSFDELHKTEGYSAALARFNAIKRLARAALVRA